MRSNSHDQASPLNSFIDENDDEKRLPKAKKPLKVVLQKAQTFNIEEESPVGSALSGQLSEGF